MKLTKEQIQDIEEDSDYEDPEWIIKEEEYYNMLKGVTLDVYSKI